MESAENGVEAAAGGVDVRIAEELIEQARKDGVSLVGPNGLLAAVTRNVLQTALAVGRLHRPEEP